MPRSRILLIGAYGQFGRRIAVELARDDVDLVLAGRRLDRAQALAASLAGDARLETARIDVEDGSLASDIAALAPTLVIHTAGPFQQRDYRVAEAAMEAGADYVDLADGREFVAGVARLDAHGERAEPGGGRPAARWRLAIARAGPALARRAGTAA